MTTEPSRGATRVRAFLAMHLADDMPILIDAARIEWEREDWEMPYPVRYNSYDPLKVDAYPTVGSMIRRTSNIRRRDYTDIGEETYMKRYNVIAFCWVRTPQEAEDVENAAYERTLLLRDDMLAIMESSIRTWPSLRSGGEIRVIKETITGDFLEPISVSSQSPVWLAGGTLTFDADVIESDYVVPLGEAATIKTEAHNIATD